MANDEQQDPQEDPTASHEISIEEEDINAETEQAESSDSGDDVESLRAELTAAKEDVLRAQAEVQNTRRRAEMDVEKAHKFGLEKFVGDLLSVVDNLERALSSIDTNDESEGMKAVTEGVELTLKSFIDTLKKHNVEPIDPAGEPFDPQLHQAMTTVESKDVEPNTVIDVFQKGYMLHGRLVRPAMVVVSKSAVEA